jgi:hypothetical protein
MERVTLELLPRAGFPVRRPRVRWSHSDAWRRRGGELVHQLTRVLHQDFREGHTWLWIEKLAGQRPRPLPGGRPKKDHGNG